jgi:hypothetical protein
VSAAWSRYSATVGPNGSLTWLSVATRLGAAGRLAVEQQVVIAQFASASMRAAGHLVSLAHVSALVPRSSSSGLHAGVPESSRRAIGLRC